MKHPSSPSALDLRNHVIDRVLGNTKTHAESRTFTPTGNGQRFETALFFADDALNQELAQYPLRWGVKHGNLQNARTFGSWLLAETLGRIRGLDAQSPGVTFLYRTETRTPAFWHENRYYFDRDGLMQNEHLPLPDWPESFPGPNAFARKVAERWKIETWREGEDDSLFNVDEVSP